MQSTSTSSSVQPVKKKSLRRTEPSKGLGDFASALEMYREDPNRSSTWRWVFTTYFDRLASSHDGDYSHPEILDFMDKLYKLDSGLALLSIKFHFSKLFLEENRVLWLRSFKKNVRFYPEIIKKMMTLSGVKFLRDEIDNSQNSIHTVDCMLIAFRELDLLQYEEFSYLKDRIIQKREKMVVDYLANEDSTKRQRLNSGTEARSTTTVMSALALASTSSSSSTTSSHPINTSVLDAILFGRGIAVTDSESKDSPPIYENTSTSAPTPPPPPLPSLSASTSATPLSVETIKLLSAIPNTHLPQASTTKPFLINIDNVLLDEESDLDQTQSTLNARWEKMMGYEDRHSDDTLREWGDSLITVIDNPPECEKAAQSSCTRS